MVQLNAQTIQISHLATLGETVEERLNETGGYKMSLGETETEQE